MPAFSVLKKSHNPLEMIDNFLENKTVFWYHSGKYLEEGDYKPGRLATG
jgi:hypothetical protein